MNGLSFFYTPCVFFKKGFEQRSLVFPLFFGKGEKQGFFFFSFFCFPFSSVRRERQKRAVSLVFCLGDSRTKKGKQENENTFLSLEKRKYKKRTFFYISKKRKKAKGGWGKRLGFFFCLDKREKKVYRGGLFGIKSSPLSLSFPFSFFSKKKGGKSPSLLLFWWGPPWTGEKEGKNKKRALYLDSFSFFFLSSFSLPGWSCQ